MFSQHPDHAQKPYWHTHALIKTHDELKECFLMFKQLKGEEVMWDWEGKLVDESVIEKLLFEHTDFFKQNPMGEKVFLTFRVPNPRVESGYRLGRAFMVVLSAQDLASTVNLPSSPLFEVILPMTESYKEMINVQKSFQKITQVVTDSFGTNIFNKKPLEIIPIFESVETILNSGQIVRSYAASYKKDFKKNLVYLRPFCARSDPALNSGIVPTTLAIKHALSEFAEFSRQTGILTYPIIAPGALPFRGGLTPENFESFIKEFAGIKTLVIQSAFRYDYPLNKVKQAILKIPKVIKKYQSEILPKNTLEDIKQIIPLFENPYKESIENLAPLIQKVSLHIPKRRERVQHVGLFGYSRSMGKTSLPRAIGFTASCYSLGIPPELVGTGRGLKKAKSLGKLEVVEKLYQQLKPALLQAGRYLRKESLNELKLEDVKKDIEAIEEYLGQNLGSKTQEEKQHEKLVKKIILKIQKNQNPQEEIEQAAILRKSMG